MSTLAIWHEMIETMDMSRLDEVIADNCVFYSPVVHTPQEGKALTIMYLTGAGNVFNDSFHYVKEVVTDTHAVLEFECEVDGIIERGDYRHLYMHRTGHWLGLDVHDVGDYRIGGEWRQLEPGMTLTVEPGLYIAPDDDTVEERWRGIGIRIEDDVLVTKEGCDVLTRDVPKAIDDIEALMREARA